MKSGDWGVKIVRYTLLAVLAALCILVTVLAVRDTKRFRAHGPTRSVTPFVFTVEQALDRPEGWGVIRVYDGIPKNIAIAVNARTTGGVRVDRLGLMVNSAHEYLGDNFHLSFSEDKDKTGRTYVVLFCEKK